MKTETMYSLVILHNFTIMYNYIYVFGQEVSLFFTLKYVILRGKLCISDKTKICPFQALKMAGKKVLAVTGLITDFKKKGQKYIIHILNITKLLFSGHGMNVFSFRMSSQNCLGLYGMNHIHFSFLNLYHP